MTDILRLADLNINSVILGMFMIMAAVIACAKIIGEFSVLIKHPVKWVKKREAVARKVDELEKDFIDSKAKAISHDERLDAKIEELATKLSDLTEIVVDDRIERMRYEILDMASAISEANRWYSVEQIKHALKVYDEYEEFLVRHHKTNGEIEMSIEVIKKAYRDKYAGMKDVV